MTEVLLALIRQVGATLRSAFSNKAFWIISGLVVFGALINWGWITEAQFHGFVEGLIGVIQSVIPLGT